MKKTFTLLAVLATFLVTVSSSYAQVVKNAGHDLKIVNGTSSELNLNKSPDLGHAHDGHHCLSDQLTNDWVAQAGIEDKYQIEVEAGNQIAAEMDGSGSRATYNIPIIFHVIYNPNNPAENVSEQDINDLLDAVNLDFTAANADIGNLRSGFGWVGADSDIEFCMAQKDPWGQQLTELGINRVSTNEDFYDPNTESNKMKGDTGGDTGTPGWDRNSYVNVWICDITNGAPSGTAGYAYKPTISSLPPASIDGIVIDYNLGMPPTNRVLTHEIGHYLGLSHTWGNSNQASGCTQDDGLADTPLTAGPSFDYSGSCSGNQSTCSGVETQYENFMDYASCTIIYTQDQADLMTAVLTGSRSSLLASDACTPVNPQPPVTDFIADITTVIQGGSINFTDLSTNYPTGWTWTVAPAAGVTFIAGTDMNSQNAVISFANTGLYTVTLNASNAYGNDDEIKTDYITVVASGGGAIACDTLRNWTPGASISSVTGASGYLMGNTVNGTIDVTGWAEEYTFTSNTNIRRLRFLPWKVNDMGGSIVFKIYNDDNGGEPGTVLSTSTMALADMNEGFWNTVDFGGGGFPVSAGQNFFVGYEPSYASTDSFALTLNFNGTGSPAPETFMEILGTVGGPWHPVVDLYTINSQPANTQFLLDVLTSNGPAPSALAAWPPNETCEGMEVTMNASGSANTESYYWDITDGTNDYFFDEANLTTTFFTQGTWTFNLEVDGSCITDIDGPFVLTVNPPMQATFTVADENCIAADGTINIAITGGDGGAYNYSINNGTTTEATGSYTGLITGDYTYILSDNANCELTGTVNVGNINAFSPTITADMTVASGTPTDLTVTGGASWSWYANEGGGPIQVGTTQTINVAPVVTTTYVCNVTDGSGCEAELEVTLTVASGLDEGSLANSFSIYPNPTNGEFSLIFNLNEARDMDIEIMNMIGQKVFESEFSQVKNQTINFDLNAVAAGVYFVTIQSGEETVSKKVVVR